MNTIVIYTSKYGSTKKYAQWIAEALNCPAKSLKDVSAEELAASDTIIYGGGLYAGTVAGLKKFLSRLASPTNKKLVLCMVGMTNPTQTSFYKEITERNLPAEWKDIFKVFALHGDLQFSKMSVLHKLVMRMPKSMAEKKPQAERTEDDKYFIENFGRDVIWSGREQIKPVVNYLMQK